MANARGEAQMRAHLLDGTRADGRVSRLPLRLLETRAVRVDEGVVPGDLRRHQAEGRSRPVGAGRFDVGRGRLQPAVRRGAGQAAAAWQTVFHAGIRLRNQGPVAAGCLRLSGFPAAADPRVRLRLLPHAEALRARAQQARPPYLYLGADP